MSLRLRSVWALVGDTLRRFCPLGAVLMSAVSPATLCFAYTRSTLSATDPHPIAWDFSGAGTFVPAIVSGRIVYRLHSAGSADVSDGSDLDAVESAFRTWSGVTGSKAGFARGSDLALTATLPDGEFPVFWTESSTIVTQGTASTDDDVSVAGALAVTFVYRLTSGPEAGEIVDANIVLNGAEFSWTSQPEVFPQRYDIESVAVHEIGHALGFDHSAVTSATMFPRTGAGRALGRTLAEDDVAAVRAAYAGDNTPANRGVLTGTLSNGVPVFGGLVWARDADGRVLAHAMTGADGVFRIEALPPGPVTVLAQPVAPSAGFSLFSALNLGPNKHDKKPTFLPTAGVPAVIRRAQETTLEIEAQEGTPAMEIKLIGRSGSYSNAAVALRRGETNVLIGVAGPGLPAGGAPLSISGGGFSTGSTRFGTVAGFPAVSLLLSVSPGAALGPRDLVIEAGGERAYAIGGVEVLHALSPEIPGEVPAGGSAGRPLTVEHVGAAIDLTWDQAPGASAYRLYRGHLAFLRAGAADHEAQGRDCRLSVTDASIFEDATDAGAYYYLVTGLDHDREGPIGADSAGFPRPHGTSSCP